MATAIPKNPKSMVNIKDGDSLAGFKAGDTEYVIKDGKILGYAVKPVKLFSNQPQSIEELEADKVRLEQDIAYRQQLLAETNKRLALLNK